MTTARAINDNPSSFEVDFSLRAAIKQFRDYEHYRSKLLRPDHFILSVLPIFMDSSDLALESWHELFNLCFRHVVFEWMSVDLASAMYAIFEKFQACEIAINSEIRDYTFYLIIQVCIKQSLSQPYLDILSKNFWKKYYSLFDSEKLAIDRSGYLSANTSTLFNMSYTPAIAAHHSHIRSERHRRDITVGAESPERFDFSMLRLSKIQPLTQSNPALNPDAIKLIKAIHEEAYLILLKQYSELSNILGLRLPLDKHGDTLMSPNSYQAAIECACMTMDLVGTSYIEHKPALVIARPPGHHAGRNFGEGFCLINNVACAALQLIELNKLNKIFILDIEAHKGNGTYDIVCHHPAFQQHVVFEDIYDDRIYHGHEDGHELEAMASHAHEMPLTKPANARMQEAIFQHIVHCLEQENFDFVLVSFGIDGHKCDPIGGELGYDDEFYVAVTRILTEKMRGKCAFIVEGGYNQTVNMRIINRCIDTIEHDRPEHRPR